MLSWKPKTFRYALVLTCFIALLGGQLLGSVLPPAARTSILPTTEGGSSILPNSYSPAPARARGQDAAELKAQMEAVKQQMELSGPTPDLVQKYEKLLSQMEALDAPAAAAPDAPTATSLCVSGSLDPGDPTYQRPTGASTEAACTLSGVATAVRYDQYAFNVTGCTGISVTASLCGTAPCSGIPAGSTLTDTLVFVYQKPGGAPGSFGSAVFNPLSPCTNLKMGNDDSCASRSQVTTTISPGVFVVVVTAFANANSGTYNLGVTTTGTGTCSVTLLPTAAKLDSFTATNYGGEVALEWKTGHEVDNLGFNVYRDERGKRTRVNSQMVAGSALLAGPNTILGAGQSYGWSDRPSQRKDAQYWLEEIDLNGQSTWHGPVSVTDSGDRNVTPPRRGRNTLLSALGVSSVQPSSGPVEARASLPEATEGRMQAQSSIASRKAVKLSVRQEGVYRVSQPELVQAGLDADTDPRMLQLYVDGRQVPIAEVNTANGRFTSSSAIEFYGVGIDSAVTDSRTYWLVAGSEPGLRIGQAAGKVKAGKSTPQSFPYTVERKDRSIYFSSLLNGEKENFFGAVIARNPVDQALSLRHLDASASEAILEVSLQGVTLVPHRVEARINGARAGQISFEGQAEGVARFPIPQALLKEGQNLVTLVPQGEQSDVSLVDYIRVTYQRGFTADNDALKFTANPRQAVTVDGFSNPAIRVFDITDRDNVQEVSGKVKQRGAGYSVSLGAQGNSQRTLLALAGDGAKRPSAIAASSGANLRQAGPGADLVIITRRNFFDSLSPLVALRQSQGLTVAVVDVEDIYDSFSFGQKTPQALKDYLAYARAGYKTAPRYVLIAGDASLDSKDYLGLGDNDIVPTKLIDTRLMETASDDWFVETEGGVAQMAIGRLPVGTPQEASSMVAKIVAYDQSTPSQEMLLVSDSNDDYNFEDANAQLRGLIPSRLRVERIDRGKDGDSVARAKLLNALARGQKVVNYVGHGSVDQWKANLLTGADINEIQGAGGLPVFVMMTCLNGYFQDVSLDSLAESLVKAPRGAIAVWASSGMTSPDVQSPANQELYRLLFNKSNSSTMLGDAIRGAKAAAGSQDVRQTWILFGDPTMTIR